jgi:hypothetical protein
MLRLRQGVLIASPVLFTYQKNGVKLGHNCYPPSFNSKMNFIS